MLFKDVKFFNSVSLSSDKIFLEEKKEIVFVGRSNVGKSSIMNLIFGKKDLVKTSSRPGKTKTANIFIADNKYYFTDLPGYGFAKLGKSIKEEFDGLINWYIEEKINTLKMVYILVDSKLGPQQTDIDMYKFLLDLGVPVTIVLSKIDKLSKNEANKSLSFTKEQFFGVDIIPVSSSKRTGLPELEKSIKEALSK